ncbi:UNVERIFIED_CONTAM: hypothetical protein Sradi_3603100 [Sesamum radiatum]|uniref:Uncharacterized protein n=1 Tax=Sesamum radiatum TaxID=300843 RepID=A0AAW2QH06_SESRA
MSEERADDPASREHRSEKLPVEEQRPENTFSKGVIHMIVGGPTNGTLDELDKPMLGFARAIMEIDDKAPVGDLVIHFGPYYAQGVYLPHNGALVISATLAKYTVERIFLDPSSSGDVLFYKVYYQMELGDIPLESVDTSLYNFAGEMVHPLVRSCFIFPLGAEPTRKARWSVFLWWTYHWPTTLSSADLL